MANEAQHSSWRQDSRDNIEAARELAETPEDKLFVYLAGADIAMTASLAERVKELSTAVYESTGALIEEQRRAVQLNQPLRWSWWRRWNRLRRRLKGSRALA